MSGDRSDRTLMRRIRRGVRLCKLVGLLCGLAMPSSFSLVNGSPELIEVGSYQLTQADLARADVQRLLRRNPDASLIYKLRFVGRRETANGGSRFVFSDAFADCRACKRLAGADIAYDFDSHGVFHGAKLLRVVPRQF